MQLTELITIPTLVAVVYFSPVDLCFWQNWPSLEQSLTQQHACPRAAYSNCHCVIARNLHVPVSDGVDTSERDGLALLAGLPIGREWQITLQPALSELTHDKEIGLSHDVNFFGTSKALSPRLGTVEKNETELTSLVHTS